MIVGKGGDRSLRQPGSLCQPSGSRCMLLSPLALAYSSRTSTHRTALPIGNRDLSISAHPV